MVSDIAEIEAHRDRAQAAYDKLPSSGPVTSWCELYGEDLLDSCTKLLAALKQRIELIDAAAGHWLESCRTTSPPIPWEGAIDGAMEAACKEVKRLRARVAELEGHLEKSRTLGKIGGYPCTPEQTWAEGALDRTSRVAKLEYELHEQSRLLGMGGEREARLMARVGTDAV